MYVSDKVLRTKRGAIHRTENCAGLWSNFARPVAISDDYAHILLGYKGMHLCKRKQCCLDRVRPGACDFEERT